MPQIIQPPDLAKARGYSNGLAYPAGQILFVAGQIGWDAECKLVSAAFAAQYDQALANVMSVVREAGAEATAVGRMTVYVTDKQAYLAVLKELGAIHKRHMGKHYPAMSLVEVKDLLEEGALVEIEATAVIPALVDAVAR